MLAQDAVTHTKGMQFDGSRLLSIAKTAYFRSARSPSDALVAVLFAAAAVEAFINEFPELLSFIGEGVVPERLRGLEDLLWRSKDQNTSSALKLQMIATFAGGKAFDKGRQPYQDYTLLSVLRNKLVHLKPTVVVDAGSDGMRPAKIDVVEKLKARGLELNPVAGPSAWMSAISTPSVARWADDTAAIMMRTIVELIPGGVARVFAQRVVKSRSSRLSNGCTPAGWR